MGQARLMLEMFGMNNYGRSHVDEVFKLLYDEFGDQQELDEDGIQLVRDYYRKHKDLSDAVEELITPFKTSNPIHFEDQAELYPGKHSRSEGPRVEELGELTSHESFFSYDVLQQTPECVDAPVDQQHVVTDWKPTSSNIMPDARWNTNATESEFRGRDDTLVTKESGVTQVYKFAAARLILFLTSMNVVDIDINGTVVGLDGVHNTVAVNKAKKLSQGFKRVGIFYQKVQPSPGDFSTPKVDGEALFITAKNGMGAAVSRLGDKWSLVTDMKFRILVECVPSIKHCEKIFLTHAWRLTL